MSRIWLVNWHFQSRITLWCRHKSTNVSMGLCWQMFIIWRLWFIYFDHHLSLEPSIGKRRKQSCTPNKFFAFFRKFKRIIKNNDLANIFKILFRKLLESVFYRNCRIKNGITREYLNCVLSQKIKYPRIICIKTFYSHTWNIRRSRKMAFDGYCLG